MLISKMLGATMVVGAPDPGPLARPIAGRAECNVGRKPPSPRWKMLDGDRARGYISRHIPRANS